VLMTMRKITIQFLSFFVFVFWFFPAVSFSQKISAEEKKIVAYIDAHANDAISLLEKTVNIESPTENLAGVKRVGDIFKQEFESIGFSARWIDMPAEMKRAGHLIAEKNGTKGKRVLLLGHLDTVLSGEKFRLEANKAYGTGSSDMKAGNVVLFYALKALHATGALRDSTIIVMLTGDEENSGKPVEISRGDMIAAAQRSDMALSFENGGSNIATVARRGSSSWTLEVTAKTGHSAQIFRESMGSGAIFEASRILSQFYEQLHGEKYLTFNPSLIAGGTELEISEKGISATGKTNVVPAKVVIRGDLRFISEEQKETTRAKMREIVAKNLPGTSATISFSDGIPAMSPNEGNFALLKQLDAVSQDLGFGKIEGLDPGEWGAGDISYVAHLVPSLDGLGATGRNAHARGEYADLNTLPTQIKRAAILIYRLTH
jgi:glutamate carboxypeptidase